MSVSLSLKHLRTAFSALCGFACILLLSMWLRSYRVCDYLTRIGASNYYTEISSHTGGARVYFGPLAKPHAPVGWTYHRKEPLLPYRGFVIDRAAKLVGINVPYWFLILVAAALAGISASRPYRVSLRALLILTTLTCMALGAIIYPATR